MTASHDHQASATSSPNDIFQSVLEAARLVLQNLDRPEGSNYFEWDNIQDKSLFPVLIDSKPLMAYFAHVLNNDSIGPTMERYGGKDLSQIGFHRSRPFQDYSLMPKASVERKLRYGNTWPYTENEHKSWQQKTVDFPLALTTVYTFQSIIEDYYQKLQSALNKDEKFLSKKIQNMATACKDICMELLPVIGHGLNDIPKGTNIEGKLESIFRTGLAATFSMNAFTSGDGRFDPTTCPFKSKIGRIWNMHLVQDENGIYQIQPVPKPAALPVLLATMISKNDMFQKFMMAQQSTPVAGALKP